MEKCTRHPERETRFQCLKHGTWMCEECLGCRDPHIYCKHRSACPVWFIEKAVRIGLLPDIDRAKFRHLGNRSIAGTRSAGSAA